MLTLKVLSVISQQASTSVELTHWPPGKCGLKKSTTPSHVQSPRFLINLFLQPYHLDPGKTVKGLNLFTPEVAKAKNSPQISNFVW